MNVTDLEAFDPPTDWVNYGDVNPEPHGGLFVRWDPDHNSYELVETHRCDQVMPDGDPGSYVITLGECDASDIFTDGDPSKGLTDWMKGELESLGREHFDPDRHPDEPTSYAPEFIENLAYYAANHVRYYGGDSRIESGDYEEVLSKFDVDDWD